MNAPSDARRNPPLIRVPQISIGRARLKKSRIRLGGFPHPLLGNHALAIQFASMQRHQAEAPVIPYCCIETSERAFIRLILAAIQKRIVLRADLLPQPVLHEFMQRLSHHLLQQQSQHLGVDALIFKPRARLYFGFDRRGKIAERLRTQ